MSIQPMIFNLKFEREYRIAVEDYLHFCKSIGREPSQKDYKLYCYSAICEEIENFTDIMAEATIEERENHIASISNL